ncbi:MAG TPA: hypothetical protein DDY43_12655 [Synechococcales bacterium UBA10510]|nr:hypothetical protein [Synechococcales bacterium UBA10510]
MTVREPHKEIVSASQMADSLQWLSFALILVFLAQIITALFPIALFQPEWMVRFSGSLRGIASLPLMALGLIMLANMIDDKVLPSSLHLQLFRRIASLAAIGFLLLIPLQTYGAVVGIRSQLQQVQGQLNSLTAAAELVQQASSEPQLRDAIRAIPGAEALANRPLGTDVKTVKKALLDKLRESTTSLQTQLNESRSKATQNVIPPLIRDAAMSFAYAIGFAGMGYGQNGNSSLLRRLLNTNKRSLSKGRQLWGQDNPGKSGSRWLKP